MKNVKRILALFLCICMVVTCWTAEPLQAASIVYQEGMEPEVLYTLNDEKSVILYKDDFTSGASYTQALGTYSTCSILTYDEENCGLKSDGTNQKSALFYGLKNASSLQNYSVSADVKMNTDSKFTALVAYGQKTNNTNGIKSYEFGIVGTNLDFNGDGTKEYVYCFRLYQRGEGESLCKAEKGTAVATKLAIEDYNENYANYTINLRMDVKTQTDKVVFNCYASLPGGTEQLIFENVEDTSDVILSSGVPGIRSNDDGLINAISVIGFEADDTEYLYKDSFSYAGGYKAALGEDAKTSNMKLENNALKIQNNATGFTLFSGIENAASMTDYTISGNFIFDQHSENRNGGILIYGSTNGTTDTYGYEFAINKGLFRLYRRSNQTGGSATLKTSTQTVSQLFSAEEYVENSQPITLSTTVIKNVDDSVTLICNALYKGVELEVFTYTDTSEYRITQGIPGIRGNQDNTIVDDVAVRGHELENVYDISQYRENIPYTYPMPTGLVFAGWYTDQTFKTAVDETVTKGIAYAKFVDEDVLKVVNQLPLYVSKEDQQTNLRLLTSVDSEKYRRVGFTVTLGDKEYDFTNVTEVYENVTAIEGVMGAVNKKAYQVFENSDSKYFMAQTLTGILQEDFSEQIKITPEWETLDGTIVTGQIKEFSINSAVDSLSSAQQ